MRNCFFGVFVLSELSRLGSRVPPPSLQAAVEERSVVGYDEVLTSIREQSKMSLEVSKEPVSEASVLSVGPQLQG